MSKSKTNKKCPKCGEKLLLCIIEDLAFYVCPYCKYHPKDNEIKIDLKERG